MSILIMAKKEKEYELESEEYESDNNDDDNNDEETENENDDDNETDSENETTNSDIDDDEISETSDKEGLSDDDDIHNEISSQRRMEMKYVSDNDRISPDRMTKYELTRIIGERTKQLVVGAKPLIKNPEDFNSSEEIAIEELKQNMIPFKIRRMMPNGKNELWKISEFKKDHIIHILNN